MRRMRQTVGEKQTFLVQAKSYRTISGSVWAAMFVVGFNKDWIMVVIVEFTVGQFYECKFWLKPAWGKIRVDSHFLYRSSGAVTPRE